MKESNQKANIFHRALLNHSLYLVLTKWHVFHITQLKYEYFFSQKNLPLILFRRQPKRHVAIGFLRLHLFENCCLVFMSKPLFLNVRDFFQTSNTFMLKKINKKVKRIYFNYNSRSILKSMNRLVSMTSGIGDPLVAAFTNCYICRVNKTKFQTCSLLRQWTYFSWTL